MRVKESPLFWFVWFVLFIGISIALPNIDSLIIDFTQLSTGELIWFKYAAIGFGMLGLIGVVRNA